MNLVNQPGEPTQLYLVFFRDLSRSLTTSPSRHGHSVRTQRIRAGRMHTRSRLVGLVCPVVAVVVHREDRDGVVPLISWNSCKNPPLLSNVEQQGGIFAKYPQIGENLEM